MRDFTLYTFLQLLTTLKEQQYTFMTFAGFISHPAPKSVILRHDVDARKMNSLQTAILEKELGIIGTYYFRTVSGSFDEDIIKQIAGLGHEIGYHYEDVSLMAERQKIKVKSRSKVEIPIYREQKREEKRHWTQDTRHTEEELVKIAIESFRDNLERLRRIVPVKTICMHGSPMSRWDNRLLWKYYDYRNFGIIGEPYFDVNFEEVLYLTDTGRCWDGDLVSIRDKAQGSGLRAQERARLRDEELQTPATQDPAPSIPAEAFFDLRSKAKEVAKAGTKHPVYQPKLQRRLAPSTKHPATFRSFHSTFDIIRAAETGSLPAKIMFTIHPQRWDNRMLPWIRELVWQNVKNVGKRIITSKQSSE